MEDFIIEEFKAYKVFLLSGIENDASIHIKVASGIAVIRFSNGKLPDNAVVTKENGLKLFKVHVPTANFPYYVDIMRNEGPLFFFYDSKDNVSYITTTDEPVGEGELSFRAT